MHLKRANAIHPYIGIDIYEWHWRRSAGRATACPYVNVAAYERH